MLPHPHAEDREAAAADVRYELNMLHAMAQALIAAAPLPGVQRNALLEAYLLHLRNLERFFCLERRSDDLRDWDNLLAFDYFDQPSQWKTAAVCRALLSATCRNLERLNKLLTHLMDARVRVCRAWPVQELRAMTAEIDGLWQKFLAALGAVAPDRALWFTEPKHVRVPTVADDAARGVIYTTHLRP